MPNKESNIQTRLRIFHNCLNRSSSYKQTMCYVVWTSEQKKHQPREENAVTTTIRFIHVGFQISVTIHMYSFFMWDAFFGFCKHFLNCITNEFVRTSHIVLPRFIENSHMLEFSMGLVQSHFTRGVRHSCSPKSYKFRYNGNKGQSNGFNSRSQD